jgi:hypothetical protein
MNQLQWLNAAKWKKQLKQLHNLHVLPKLISCFDLMQRGFDKRIMT